MTVELQRVMKLAGNIPFDSIDDADIIIENFCSKHIAVVVTNKDTNIKHGTHEHDSYEFVICYTKLNSAIIDGRLFNRMRNSLFAVNPMQRHGLINDIKGFNLCGIHMDRELINGVARDMYGSDVVEFSNDSFVVNHDLNMLVRLFLEELRYRQSGYEYLVENLGFLIAGNLMRQITHNLALKPQLPIQQNEECIKAVIDYMNENYTSGVSCEELAKLVNMNKFCFIRSFKAKTKKTPYEFLLDLKIEKAKKMLQSKDFSITDISMQCGFSSHSHFTTTFKKRTGVSPTDYRMNL